MSTSCTSTAQVPSRARLCTGSGTRCACGVCCGGGATRRDHNYAGCEAAPHALSKPAQSSAGGGQACDKGFSTPARSWPHRRATLGGRVARGAARLLDRGRIADGEDAAVAADDAQELVGHDGAEVRLPRQLALPARARPCVAAAAPAGFAPQPLTQLNGAPCSLMVLPGRCWGARDGATQAATPRTTPSASAPGT